MGFNSGLKGLIITFSPHTSWGYNHKIKNKNDYYVHLNAGKISL